MRTSNSMARQATGSFRDPRALELVADRSVAKRTVLTGRRSLSWILWFLLVLSFAFLGGVQIYVRNLNGKLAPASSAQGLDGGGARRLISTQSPSEAVNAGNLWLQWEPVPGADRYHLRIHSLTGSPVVDPAEVYGTTWNPPDALLPGLPRGEYRWQVEALDARGALLARSKSNSFLIEW